MNKLLAPKVDLSALIIRLGLAAIFLVHGYFKVIQDDPLLEQLSKNTELMVGWVELICGAMLGLGLLSRLAAIPLIVEQVFAIVLVTGSRTLAGPMIKATGADYTKVGPEFNLVLIAMCLAVILLGSGAASLDHCLLRLLRRKPAQASVASPAVAHAE
jgi:uncharacterized membrane protein YphA (DoxX/SURF4 family)